MKKIIAKRSNKFHLFLLLIIAFIIIEGYDIITLINNDANGWQKEIIKFLLTFAFFVFLYYKLLSIPKNIIVLENDILLIYKDRFEEIRIPINDILSISNKVDSKKKSSTLVINTKDRGIRIYGIGNLKAVMDELNQLLKEKHDAN